METQSALTTVTKLQTLVNEVEGAFLNGDVSGGDALILFGGIKTMNKKLEEVVKKQSVKDVILGEFEKYGEKKVTVGGFDFSKRSFVKYDYSTVGHPVIDMQEYVTEILEESVKEAKEKAKGLARSNSLFKETNIFISKQSVNNLLHQVMMAFDGLLSNFEDGQEHITIELNPPSMTSTESLIAKVKKQ